MICPVIDVFDSIVLRFIKNKEKKTAIKSMEKKNEAKGYKYLQMKNLQNI